MQSTGTQLLLLWWTAVLSLQHMRTKAFLLLGSPHGHFYHCIVSTSLLLSKFVDVNNTLLSSHHHSLSLPLLTITHPPQLWQARGLDLYLIPYGCIATGHNMGMIQVVQDAETVAKV